MEESHLDIEKTRWRGAQLRRSCAVLFTFSSEIHLCQTGENNHQHYRIAVVDVVSHPAVNTDLAGSALFGLVAALLRFSPTRLSQGRGHQCLAAAEEAICIVPKYCVGRFQSLDNMVFCPSTAREKRKR